MNDIEANTDDLMEQTRTTDLEECINEEMENSILLSTKASLLAKMKQKRQEEQENQNNEYHMKPTHELHSDANYLVGCVSVKGTRDHQEDRYVFDLENHLFAIYDGHGGAKISDYLKEHLLSEIKINLDNKQDKGIKISTSN